MVRNHQHLKPKLARRAVYDVNQFGHQLRPQPAILLVEYQKLTVLIRIESGQREHSQTDAEHILYRPALPSEDIFSVAVALDGKIDRCRAAFEVRIGFEFDWLPQHFLNRACQICLKDTQHFFEQRFTERFESGGCAVGNFQKRLEVQNFRVRLFETFLAGLQLPS